MSESEETTPIWRNLSLKAIERLLEDQASKGYEFQILKGHLLIEEALDVLLDHRLPAPGKLRQGGRRLSFDLKLRLAQALGVVPDEHAQAIEALNALRNKIGHVEGYEVKAADLLQLRLAGDADTERHIQNDIAKGNLASATQTATSLLVFTVLELVWQAEWAKNQGQQP